MDKNIISIQNSTDKWKHIFLPNLDTFTNFVWLFAHETGMRSIQIL